MTVTTQHVRMIHPQLALGRRIGNTLYISLISRRGLRHSRNVNLAATLVVNFRMFDECDELQATCVCVRGGGSDKRVPSSSGQQI